ncbi:hypothetical protein [Flavobacterium taihuense]|uniref:Uncharacterized protein n=1 Tax=Flavobacterium taihuense TaxID=2857508 RepID=A0ABS6Y1Q7_9FLAO|nr:hypothetical protein [Flavobacterium taihuense]MBW4362822.1 hypothetical protein [Flavobacterium taihuense]
MSKYDKLDLVSIEILKILSDYSFEEVQEILKKTELLVASTFFCCFDETSFKELIENIKKEIA